MIDDDDSAAVRHRGAIPVIVEVEAATALVKRYNRLCGPAVELLYIDESGSRCGGA